LEQEERAGREHFCFVPWRARNASKVFSQSMWTRFDVKTPRLTVLVCSIFLVTPAAFDQTASPGTSLTANPVFEKHCAKCHGKTAKGRHFGGPSLVSGKVETASAEDLHMLISNGKGRMPKYAGKLSADEIDTLVQEIKTMHTK
jgi:mono/diheme cytochrome c family protein